MSTLIFRALTALLVLSVGSTMAFTQTRLAWPQNNLDVSRYTTVEECLAATTRITDSVEIPRRLERATSSLEDSGAFVLPPETIQAAQRCSAQWAAVATVPLEDFQPLLRLYLQANRDGDATTLITRRLAEVASKSDSLRFAVLDTIVETLLDAQPARAGTAQPILEELGQFPKTTDRALIRLKHLNTLMTRADLYRETTIARTAAEQSIELAKTLTDADKSSRIWRLQGRAWVYLAYDYLSSLAQLDSLRRSTSAYTALVRANWSTASEEHRETMKFPVGELAPPLESEFWFAPNSLGVSDTAHGGSSVPSPNPARPTRGKVSIVLFFSNCPLLVLQCWDAYATLKRIHHQYPAVELTVTTQTAGFFQDQIPPPPAVEADFYRQWWLGFQHLPVMIAVSKTPFWRLEEPDRRRINEPVANNTNYSFGEWNVRPQTAFLVAQDGTIIYANTLGRNTERRFRELIEVLEGR